MKKTIFKALIAGALLAQGAYADTLALWTFDSLPASGITAGPYGAESGIFAASSSATGGTGGTYSSPAGWGPGTAGVSRAYSSTGWDVNDYFQFTTSTVGYDLTTITFDATGSNTGPKNFSLFYSINGTDFTSAGSYTLTNDSWNASSSPAASVKSFDLSAFDILDNKATVYFRLVDTSTTSINNTTVASGGTSRVDNFTVTGTVSAVPEPHEYAIAMACLLGLVIVARRRKLAAAVSL